MIRSPTRPPNLRYEYARTAQAASAHIEVRRRARQDSAMQLQYCWSTRRAVQQRTHMYVACIAETSNQRYAIPVPHINKLLLPSVSFYPEKGGCRKIKGSKTEAGGWDGQQWRRSGNICASTTVCFVVGEGAAGCEHQLCCKRADCELAASEDSRERVCVCERKN